MASCICCRLCSFRKSQNNRDAARLDAKPGLLAAQYELSMQAAARNGAARVAFFLLARPKGLIETDCELFQPSGLCVFVAPVQNTVVFSQTLDPLNR